MSAIETFSAEVAANEPNQSVIPTNSNAYIFKLERPCYSCYFNGTRFFPLVMVEWGHKNCLSSRSRQLAGSSRNCTPPDDAISTNAPSPASLRSIDHLQYECKLCRKKITLQTRDYHGISLLLSLLHGSCTFRGPSDTLPMKQLKP